jgi:hypothetical protein
VSESGVEDKTVTRPGRRKPELYRRALLVLRDLARVDAGVTDLLSRGASGPVGRALSAPSLAVLRWVEDLLAGDGTGRRY